MKIYNTKEKGLEIKSNNLSKMIQRREIAINMLESQINIQWNLIKDKRIIISNLRKESRDIQKKLNKELKRLADE